MSAFNFLKSFLSIDEGVNFKLSVHSISFPVFLLADVLYSFVMESNWLEVELIASVLGLFVLVVLLDLFRQLATSVGLCTTCVDNLVALLTEFCSVDDFCYTQ